MNKIKVVKVFFGVLVVVLFGSPALAKPTKPTFEDGKVAYDQKDYATALKIWLPLAEQGNVQAQSTLGAMYYQGQVKQDYKQAFKWFSKAAEQGSGDVQLILSQMYMKGIGVAHNGYKAAYWLVKAAESHSTPKAEQIVNKSKHDLLQVSSMGMGTEDHDSVVYVLDYLAKDGDQDIRSEVGIMHCKYHLEIYDLGTGGADPADWSRSEVSVKKAMPLLVEAADRGEAKAMYCLGKINDHHIPAPLIQGKEVVVSWYLKAAERGHADAQYELGSMYYCGQDDVVKDTKQADYWLTTAAKQGHELASSLLERLRNGPC